MFDEAQLLSELKFKAIRSSGAGGQHVNKVSSKIELTFYMLDSVVLNNEQKELLSENLKTRLTKEGLLILQCDESRSQHKNKTIAIQRFLEIINKGLIVPKKRIPTKTPKAVVKKRLDSKRKTAEKKANRKPPSVD
ncbi:alternative ribosome rescue aminoacyl-tRNA hydrolase ArfB [Ichthyenterobacterium magnum]|uniref:Ribosome-associated protein n=1 Tax=Ichthyenterobacterium magnum TaxID=1230530 RepID=A0A420DWD4_9FLAO|nr:alternative ribosome rescue aminoacyl-tRNA hydrolase ArfB [Ichthyenterobacterium magnum]RKE98538.1 ribosome-associated protein [Ichthyenterobacterium magnum]